MQGIQTQEIMKNLHLVTTATPEYQKSLFQIYPCSMIYIFTVGAFLRCYKKAIYLFAFVTHLKGFFSYEILHFHPIFHFILQNLQVALLGIDPSKYVVIIGIVVKLLFTCIK